MTGASSGFGALSAGALAAAGHIVYAGIAGIFKECGRLDVVVHDGGHMLFGLDDLLKPRAG